MQTNINTQDVREDTYFYFSEFSLRLYQESNPGRFLLNGQWISNLMAVVTLNDTKYAGSILFLSDDQSVPMPVERDGGGVVLHYRWRDFETIYQALLTHKSIPGITYGAIMKEKNNDGTHSYPIIFSR